MPCGLAARIRCAATVKSDCASALLKPGTVLGGHGRVYRYASVIIGIEAASINVHQKEGRTPGQPQCVLHLRRAAVIGVVCLITSFALPQTAPAGTGASRTAVQKGKASEADQSGRKRL